MICSNWIGRYDYRIKYLNLKKARSQNALSLEDVHKLWIPFLVFDNTERNEATKVGEDAQFFLGTSPKQQTLPTHTLHV